MAVAPSPRASQRVVISSASVPCSVTIGSCLSRVLAGQPDLLAGLGLGGGQQASATDPAASRAGKARRVGIRALSHVELAPDRRPRRPHGYLPG